MIEITARVSIPEAELKFTASRSSGPGGQHINKVDTRVTLWFDVANSRSLSADQKHRVLTRLASRVNREGILRVVAQKTRSQAANRDIAVERFVELLCQALKQEPPRRKTEISEAAKERRLAEKRYHSRLKRERSKKIPPEDWTSEA